MRTTHPVALISLGAFLVQIQGYSTEGVEPSSSLHFGTDEDGREEDLIASSTVAAVNTGNTEALVARSNTSKGQASSTMATGEPTRIPEPPIATQAWDTTTEYNVPSAATMLASLTAPEDATPTSPSSAAPSALSTTGILAIIGVLTTIILSAIAVWQAGQGIRYPRREHKKRMLMLDVELQMAIVQQRAANEALAQQRQ
ncbi:hypothetical protein FRB95_003541 [Tulasnella sp. JGI-2019a]|nr:hypothetical protein FRB95_003541 [Tulasnella sp. JGI-2019a]